MFKNRKIWLSGPYIFWIIAFTVLPIFMILYYALTGENGEFTMENLAAITDPIHVKALLLSMKMSILCTAACLLLSYPLAMILKGLKLKRQASVVFIFVLPMWMNFMLRILAWQMLLSNNGIINAVLGFFGIPAQHMLNTEAAVIFGMVYDFLPFMILPLYNSIVKIHNEVIDAAKDLGAGSVTIFFRIILPLTIPGIVSGFIMVFIPALTTFVISKLLGGSKVLLIGNVIEEEFTQASNWHLGSGLSIVLMLFIIVNMVLSAIFDKDGEGSFL